MATRATGCATEPPFSRQPSTSPAAPKLPPTATDAAALLWVANPGMRGGRAIAELLLGLIEPSGRLPTSFARHAGQQPTYYNQIRGQHGDRYADLTQQPAFAFGEGLSCTRVDCVTSVS